MVEIPPRATDSPLAARRLPNSRGGHLYRHVRSQPSTVRTNKETQMPTNDQYPEAPRRGCAKCNSTDLLKVPTTPSDHSHIVVGERLMHDVPVCRYVCTDCGHV